ncbi:zinc ribbon domain-containing protein [Rhodoluna lacicola]|jgi:predicted  nucleic acid-binding Zn-ribbon protein|uniref:Zn-ribbon protein, possibly nucleic acid-binding n=1 Tax=Rhodoluna lacicola TaxID=529884 RepID=A0A060JC59_9MICO|nr:C4-type zinc ribbon domain-containing protein [Rhodoluna lacicola]AIC47466.1 Zn-ribbon protein, possibly nucleic acid-binding [Rhodoluna lacicola]
MKASESQQADLLSLSNLDLEITRTRVAIAALTSGEAFAALRQSQRDAAASLIESRNQLDSVELELSRAEADLKLVEQRIDKDNQRLNQTSSSKDAQGIQAELETLKKRKSDLEDFELSILERKEQAEAAYQVIIHDKKLIDDELATKESENEAQIIKLRSGLDLLTQQRNQQASRIQSDLLELYEKKSSRGLAIGRLVNRECGACRITIGATALAEISGLARDEVATCPDCQAILVR